MSASLQHLLSEWRVAERAWEQARPGDPGYRDAAIAVLDAWLAYQQAAEQESAGEFALVADDEHRFVAVSAGVDAALGYDPTELVGRQIEDFAAPELVSATAEQWNAFLAAGRQDGTFRLRARDGRLVRVSFQARAHYPVAGFHLSRLRVIE